MPDNVKVHVQGFCHSKSQDLIDFARYITTYEILEYEGSLFDLIPYTTQKHIIEITR